MSWVPRPKSGTTKPCETCGKDVYSFPGRIKKFCGMACRDVMVRAKRVRSGEARCARCRTWKPLDEFVKGVNQRPHSYCKPCSSEWFHEWRGTPPETRMVYRPAYTLSDEQKRQNKRDANRRQHMARRAAGQKPGKFDLGRMLCSQNARCAYCKQLLVGEYHIDHKTPVSRGGTNDLENLHLTCGRCNMRKGAMTHEEFLVSKRRPVVAWEDAAQKGNRDELDILAATIEALS